MNIDPELFRCTCCRRYRPEVRRGWCDDCRRERAQAARDRKKAEREIEKREKGIEDPEHVGTWSSDPDAPGGWAIKVDRWIPGHVNDVVDVGVVTRAGKRSNIRGAVIKSFYSGKYRWGTILHPPKRKGGR